MQAKNSEDGLQGEPPDQTIPFRSDQTPNWSHGGLKGTYATDQQPAGLQSVQIEDTGQPSAPHEHVQQAPSQVMSPERYTNPDNIPVQYVHPGSAVQLPANVYIVRDTITPMPMDKGDGRPTVQPSLGAIIFTRIVSIIFIVLDLILNWSQFISWVTVLELPEWMTFFEFVSSVKESPVAEAQCNKGTENLTLVYGLFIVIGTGWSFVRILNMIGETILEYQKRYSSETGTRCRGFQIIHGWVETVIAMVLDDIPQVILLIMCNVHCRIDLISFLKVLIWTLLKWLKNRTRKSTCKQIYRPCCEGICDDCCCVYRFDFICCCKIFFVRPFGWCCDKPVFEVRDYDICQECTCTRAGRCWGEIEKDPEWASNTFSNLEKLYLVMGLSIVVIAVVKNFLYFAARF